MSEYGIGGLASAKLLLVVVFSTCYWLGGRRHKWIRRYVGGILFPAGVIAFAVMAGRFAWWQLAALFTFPAALSLGYGADSLWPKAYRRGLYGFALAMAGLPLALSAWPVFAAQVVLAVGASVYLGLLNPVDAAEEEALIATLSVVLVVFYV